MAKRDDGFVWKGDHYEVRQFFLVDLVWVILMAVLVAGVIALGLYLYSLRDGDPTTIDRSSTPAPVVVDGPRSGTGPVA